MAQTFLLKKAGEYMNLYGISFNEALAIAEAHFPKVALRAKGN